MNRDEYNAKVQELQAMWGDACTLRAHHKEGGSAITHATFEVYWDGRWHQIGRQDKPFTDEATYAWNDTVELRLRGAFAGALIHS